MRLFRLKIFVLFLFYQSNTQAFTFVADSSASVDLYESEKNVLLQRIGFEKTRIANDYKSADSRLFNLVDSVTKYILEQDAPKAKRNVYLSRLHVFLVNINRYYSDSYLKSGTYLAVLSYFPEMIQWEQKDELLRNLKRYSSFSIKATRLIPNDTIAEDFLTDYMGDRTDDIFRYTEEFDDRPFAIRLLEKGVKVAPESAKRYYTTSNTVSDLLRKSKDPFVIKSLEIYKRYGIKSRAYLLLDDITHNNISIDKADSIGSKPDVMFGMLVQLCMKYEANVTYSIYRYMDNYCHDAIRKQNQEALKPNFEFGTYRHYSPEQMFVLLAYGYKETTVKNFKAMLEILHKQTLGTPVNSALIASLNKELVKDFVIYCDKNSVLDEMMRVVDDGRKDYLLSLASLQEKEILFPPFKSFAKQNPVVTKEPEDKAIIEVEKCEPSQTVMTDTSTEETFTTKPEKSVVEKSEATNQVAEINEPGISKTEVVEAMKPISAAIDIAEKKDIVSIPMEEVVQPVSIQLGNREKKIVALKKNILQTIQNIPSFINEDYAEEILLYAAQKEPDELLKKVDAYKRKSFVKKILELCAINAPVSVKRYLYNPMQPVNYILQYTQNSTVKKILEINQHIGYHSKSLLLLDDIINKRTDVKDAIAFSAEPEKLFAEMVKILSRPKYIGTYSINREMRDFSLRFIREINDKIASGGAQPFYSVDNFDASQLYFLMLYGRDEVFTSTFTGLFFRFMQKLPNSDADTFLKNINNNQFRDFISLCANYGTLEEFLSKCTPQCKHDLLVAYISNLENQKDDLSSVVLIAEAITNLCNTEILSILQENIKTEYERVLKANDQMGISIYGVLSSAISGNAKVETNWYKKISKQFKISPVSSLTANALFENEKCIEQMYFYNDDDGRSSFLNFMNTYKNQPTWVVEDHNSYVRIYSTVGKLLEIFANKPEYDEAGMSAISSYLAEKNLSATVIVHRGHSFHTESTLEKVPPTAKLIFVGSCGGFYKIPIALENAPEAHIIATKQVGTKTVNDVMLYALNENIRSGKDIVWNDFWEKIREKLGANQYFSDYIPPNKNLEAIFIRAYYKTLGV